ncbi:unnamed protein product [Gordionus sp. m RMFG-2023]
MLVLSKCFIEFSGDGCNNRLKLQPINGINGTFQLSSRNSLFPHESRHHAIADLTRFNYVDNVLYQFDFIPKFSDGCQKVWKKVVRPLYITPTIDNHNRLDQDYLQKGGEYDNGTFNKDKYNDDTKNDRKNNKNHKPLKKNDEEMYHLVLISSYGDTEDLVQPIYDIKTEDRKDNKSHTVVFDKDDTQTHRPIMIRPNEDHKSNKSTSKDKNQHLNAFTLLKFIKNKEKVLSSNFKTDFLNAETFHRIDSILYTGEAVLFIPHRNKSNNHQNYRTIKKAMSNFQTSNSEDTLKELSSDFLIEKAPLTVAYDENTKEMIALFNTNEYHVEVKPFLEHSLFTVVKDSGRLIKKNIFNDHLLKITQYPSEFINKNQYCNVGEENHKVKDNKQEKLIFDHEGKSLNKRNGKNKRHIPITQTFTMETIIYVTPKDHQTPMEYYPLIASQINNFYNDPSLGAKINFKLCDIRPYNVSLVIPDDDSGNRYRLSVYKSSNAPDIDVALLITTQFKSPPGGTLGTSSTGDICNPTGSCVVVMDSGFFTYPVIVHEMGHNLGSAHDDVNGCADNPGIMYYAASPEQANSWSPCSAFQITQTLRTNKADCLREETFKDGKNYKMEKYPGQSVSLDAQCVTGFGEGYTSTPENSSCISLYCKNETDYYSQYYVPPDGTYCMNGSNGVVLSTSTQDKVCYQSLCIDKSTIDNAKVGNWAAWSDWGSCQGFCPTGYKIRNRTCNGNNFPYGPYCDDDFVDYSLCSNNGCSQTPVEAQQPYCDANYPGGKFMTHTSYPCVKACNVNGAIYITGDSVIDGTPYNDTGLCYKNIVIT